MPDSPQPINPLRSVLAVLTGILVLLYLPTMLEQVLVGALAEEPPDTVEKFLAVRNRTSVLVVRIAAQGVVGLLAGYVAGKVARVHEVRHAAIAAILLTGAYVAALWAGDNPALPPVWAQIGVLAMTAPAMIVGASVRAQARAAEAETPHPEGANE